MITNVTTQFQEPAGLRLCLRNPIPEIADAARILDEAVSAHIAGQFIQAEELIRLADMPAIWKWTDSIWGKKSPYRQFRAVPNEPPKLSKGQRVKERMPTLEEKQQLHLRDGYHCRFCGIPVIRKEIRKRIKNSYPLALVWKRKNAEQHAAFQAMWAQYDHILPHSRGGNNNVENMLITCAPCNFGRMQFTLAEVGLENPRTRPPVCSAWDGLERFH